MSTWSFDPHGNALRAERERQVMRCQVVRQIRTAQHERAQDEGTEGKPRLFQLLLRRIVRRLPVENDIASNDEETLGRYAADISPK